MSTSEKEVTNHNLHDTAKEQVKLLQQSLQKTLQTFEKNNQQLLNLINELEKVEDESTDSTKLSS